MSITYCGRSNAGVCVAVGFDVSIAVNASVSTAVADGCAVSLGINGGVVATGEEQEAMRRKMNGKKRMRDLLYCGMGAILTDMRDTACLMKRWLSEGFVAR